MSTGLNVADEFLFFAEEVKYQLVSHKTGKCNITLTQGILRTICK